jgi:hypothetical protein
MKIIHPAGRTPSSEEDLMSYTCVCNMTVLEDQVATRMQGGVYGDTCVTCFHSCDSGTPGNRAQNGQISMNKNLV